MLKRNTMERVINKALTGDVQRNALELAAFFQENNITSKRQKTGYWADKIYFICNFKGQSVCYISMNEHEQNSWYVTGDDSGEAWYENAPLDEHLKEIAWQNIDICEDYNACGGCGSPGRMSRKIIFGKEFNNVCPVTIKFSNPDAAVVACMKAVFAARKNYISAGEKS